MAGHRNLGLGILRERDSHGVANAVGKQRANAHAALDAAILTLTGLGDAEVDGIMHVLFLHPDNEQPHAEHHHNRIGSLDTDDDIVETLLLADAQKLHTALHNPLRRVAVAVAYAVGE